MSLLLCSFWSTFVSSSRTHHYQHGLFHCKFIETVHRKVGRTYVKVHQHKQTEAYTKFNNLDMTIAGLQQMKSIFMVCAVARNVWRTGKILITFNYTSTWQKLLTCYSHYTRHRHTISVLAMPTFPGPNITNGMSCHPYNFPLPIMGYCISVLSTYIRTDPEVGNQWVIQPCQWVVLTASQCSWP